jgi:hypothetical protein
MKRRDFILGFGGAVLCSSARGQQNSPIQSTTKKRLALVAPAVKVEDLKGDVATRIYFDELKKAWIC